MIRECNTGLDCSDCLGCDSQLEGYGNVDFGFDDVTNHVKINPGNNVYVCEFCGIYTASKPRCNKCEQDD
jgi:hypothetical protein